MLARHAGGACSAGAGCNDPVVHVFANLRARRTPAVGLALVGAAIVVLGSPLLAAGAEQPARSHHARRSALAHTASICRAPRLTGLVLSLARTRAATAGCRIRLEGARVSSPQVQTIREQTPAAGRHGRVLTLWVNPLCKGEGAEGPDIKEPRVTAGPTELISGLYVVGGPLTLWSEPRCTLHPEEPGAGTITVTDPADGAIVASQTVTSGQLATIALAPGTYTIQGTFGDATVNEQPARSFPTTVVIEAGKTLRQDVFLDVP
jgi:hypothetical protein